MAKDLNKPLEFTDKGQILRTPPEHEFGVSSRRWSRWVKLLKQSANPPMWLSESFALAFLSVAVTLFVIVATLPLSADFWKEKANTATKEANMAAWVEEFGFLAVAIACSGIGVYILVANRYIRQRNANENSLVAEEMEEHATMCLNELLKKQEKQQEEQAPLVVQSN
jgi:formate hydrogenlyase subunit 3/multisubunit Na+/H+ antiporter MnhD subunit